MNIVHDGYESKKASPDNALGIFNNDWVSAIPGFGLGSMPLFSDSRVEWALANINGGISGKKVLELGPLEGGHTYMIHKQQPASILAIEANIKCFLKCLIIKNLFNLTADFLLGDFVPYCRENSERFDYVHAAGVLYHLPDPLATLSDIAKMTDQLYLWTHYVDLQFMPPNDARYKVGIIEQKSLNYDGFEYQAFVRRYLGDPTTCSTFCGGVFQNPIWLEKIAILEFLKHLGYRVQIAHDDPHHPSGPCFSVFASR